MFRKHLSILLLLIATNCLGQAYRIRMDMLNAKSGLPTDIIYNTMQDHQGFIWIATNDGYARFDGEKVLNYYSKTKRHKIYQCLEDVNGLIWIMLGGNDEILNPINNEVRLFNEYFSRALPVQFAPRKLVYQDIEGNLIYILYMNGDIYRYDGTFTKVFSPPDNSRFSEIRGYTFAVPGKNGLWIAPIYEKNLSKLNYFGGITTIPLPSDVRVMQSDKKGQAWVLLYAQDNTLYKVESDTLKPFRFPTLNSIYFFDVDDDQRIWCMDEHKLAVFDSQGNLLSSLPLEGWNENSFEEATSNFDNQGNWWLSTKKGVYIFHLQQKHFVNYLDKGYPLDSRGIWIDSTGNIFVNQTSLYRINKSGIDTLALHTSSVSIIKSGKDLLFGQYQDDVGVYHLTSHTFEKKYHVSDKSNYGDVNVLLQSSKTGRIWTAGTTGVAYLDTATNEVIHFNHYNQFESLDEYGVSQLYENQEGIWLATDNGLYLLDEAKGIVAVYQSQFPGTQFRYIYEDKAGIFWLGTQGDGLIRWDRAKHDVKQFTTNNGLSNNVIYAVYEDDYGYLWLPSNYGLMRFNKETHEVTTYLPEDGIPHQEFNFASHARAPDGRLFFGGLGGITSFYPKDFVADTLYQVPMVMVDFQKQDAQSGLFQNYTNEALANQKLIIKPNETSFTLQFALLDYRRFYDKSYAYKIEGLDKDWNYLKENSIRLGRLPYGNYTLHIKGRRYNEPWSKNEIHIPLLIIKPFYLRTWFLTLLFIILVAFIYFGIKLRIRLLERDRARLQLEVKKQTRQLQAQADKLKELDTLKSRLFANISHDFRTPLTLILTPLENLLQRVDVQETVKNVLVSIKNNANNLLYLVEELIDLSRFENKQIELEEQPVHLKQFTERIFAMYESYAQIQNIHYEFSYYAADSLIIPIDCSKVEKILNNLLSNAFKFVSEHGKIELIIIEKENDIQIQVKDDGEGIEPEHLTKIFDRYFRVKTSGAKVEAGAGIGLSIAKEYAQIMGGDLVVQSQPGLGSVFTFTFPKKHTDQERLLVELANGEAFFEKSALEFIQHKNGKNGAPQASILVVEDNLEMQALIYGIFSIYPYQLIQALDGQMALQKLENEKVDCIITDMMMPKMDGFEFINQVKSNKDTSWIPVIAVTALADKQNKLEALRIGIDDYLTKPFSANELLIRTKNLLHRSVNLSKIESPRKIESAEQRWLKEVEKNALELLEKYPDFNLLELSASLHISESNLRRKIKKITGLTANDYIKEIRLQYAKELLENKAHFTVAEVSYTVGFSSISYFIKLFSERFGKLPSEYLKNY